MKYGSEYEQDLNLLKIIYKEFNIKNPNDKIDIFCVIKRLENIPPREIKTIFRDNFSEDFYQKNKSHFDKYNDTNKFGVIMRKYFRSGIVSLFIHQEDFLNAFIKRYPTPQDIGLPFFTWELEILHHYLEIVYKKNFSSTSLNKVLAIHSVSKSAPFLGYFRNIINSNEHRIFIWYIRFIKDDTFIPIRFDYNECYSTNVNSLRTYTTSEDTIFSLLIRYLPKNVSPQNCFFMISYTKKIDTYFKKAFLTLDYIPSVNFLFYKKTDINTLFKLSDYSDFYKFYKKYLSCRKKLDTCIKYKFSTNEEGFNKLKKILKKYSK